jgi:hypothetical protein
MHAKKKDLPAFRDQYARAVFERRISAWICELKVQDFFAGRHLTSEKTKKLTVAVQAVDLKACPPRNGGYVTENGAEQRMQDVKRS